MVQGNRLWGTPSIWIVDVSMGGEFGWTQGGYGGGWRERENDFEKLPQNHGDVWKHQETTVLFVCNIMPIKGPVKALCFAWV